MNIDFFEPIGECVPLDVEHRAFKSQVAQRLAALAEDEFFLQTGLDCIQREAVMLKHPVASLLKPPDIRRMIFTAAVGVDYAIATFGSHAKGILLGSVEDPYARAHLANSAQKLEDFGIAAFYDPAKGNVFMSWESLACVATASAMHHPLRRLGHTFGVHPVDFLGLAMVEEFYHAYHDKVLTQPCQLDPSQDRKREWVDRKSEFDAGIVVEGAILDLGIKYILIPPDLASSEKDRQAMARFPSLLLPRTPLQIFEHRDQDHYSSAL